MKTITPDTLDKILVVNRYSQLEVTSMITQVINYCFNNADIKEWKNPQITVTDKVPFDNGWVAKQSTIPSNNEYLIHKLSDLKAVKVEDLKEVYDSIMDSFVLALRTNQQDKIKSADYLEKLKTVKEKTKMPFFKHFVLNSILKLQNNLVNKENAVYKVAIKCDGENYFGGNLKYSEYEGDPTNNAISRSFSRGNAEFTKKVNM